MNPNEIAELISEDPSFKETDLARIKASVSKSQNGKIGRAHV